MRFLIQVLIQYIYSIEKRGYGRFLRSFIYYSLSYVLKYRKHVVEKNLRVIVPLISDVEIAMYRKKYYRHLADLLVESLWCYKATDSELQSRVRFKNPEVVEQISSRGENITILLSHIGNWELFCQWVGMYSQKFKMAILYTPIKNKNLNDFLCLLRQRTGNQLVSTKSMLELFRLQRATPLCVNFFAIDQNPGDPYNQHWLSFFNKTVPVISGAEKFVVSQNQKVYYLYISKPDIYEVELVEINYDPKRPFDLTEKQFKLLEKNILDNPSLWLLSHNRFKFIREDS